MTLAEHFMFHSQSYHSYPIELGNHGFLGKYSFYDSRMKPLYTWLVIKITVRLQPLKVHTLLDFLETQFWFPHYIRLPSMTKNVIILIVFIFYLLYSFRILNEIHINQFKFLHIFLKRLGYNVLAIFLSYGKIKKKSAFLTRYYKHLAYEYIYNSTPYPLYPYL